MGPGPDPDDRRVLLHVGMGKTGSSALQVALVRHRDLLARHGVIYPPAPSDAAAARDGVVSGNALPLVRYLVTSKSPRRAAPEALMHEALATVRGNPGDPTMLFSSEFLHQASPDRLATLRDRCADEGRRLQVVGYVRDIAGQAVSDYGQRVKRHLMTDTFGEFLAGGGSVTYDARMREWIEPFREILGPESVFVHHYDTVRKSLVSHFFQTHLGVTLGSEHDLVERTINRSLTPSEIRLMRAVNRRLGSRPAGTLVSNALVAEPPLHETPPTITEQEFELLRERFTDEVAWVNAHGLLDGELQLISADMAVVPAPDDQTPTAEEQALVAVVARLADRLAKQKRVGAVRQASPDSAAPTPSAGLIRRLGRRITRRIPLAGRG